MLWLILAVCITVTASAVVAFHIWLMTLSEENYPKLTKFVDDHLEILITVFTGSGIWLADLWVVSLFLLMGLLGPIRGSATWLCVTAGLGYWMFIIFRNTIENLKNQLNQEVYCNE